MKVDAQVLKPSILEDIGLCNREFGTYITADRQRRKVTPIEVNLNFSISIFFEKWTTTTVTTNVVGILSVIDEIMRYLEESTRATAAQSKHPVSVLSHVSIDRFC